MDGGLVDNYGLSGFTIARQSSDTPLRFKLPPEQVDDVIAAGRDVLRASPTLRAFAGSM
jgi:NTE family protein